ncbi:MAG: hypothetical protein VYA30_05670 [Myxococcota bacterium]|nr:hypothetical protein [Myxococcota bacterium]
MKVLFASIVLSLTLCLGCGTDEPRIADSGVDLGAIRDARPSAKLRDEPPLLKAPISAVRGEHQRSDSILEQWTWATVGRDGIGFGPNSPGWDSLAKLTGRTPWSPVRNFHGRKAARLYSIGVTIAFPVGQEGPGLRYLSMWLRPRIQRQAASVFLDGKSIGTIRLKKGWHKYTLPISKNGLGVGEHKLRLWFRRTLLHRKRRSSVDFAGAWFSPIKSSSPPESWLSDEDELVWNAGPPTRWSIDLQVPHNSEVLATAEVNDGGSADFSIHVSVDGGGTTEVVRKKIDDGQTEQLKADLGRWAGRIVRLHFRSSGAGRPIESAQWSQIDVRRKISTYEPVPTIRNIVLFVVEGLWADAVRLGRAGDFVDTRNIELLASEGGIGLETWSGGLSNIDAHRRILGPTSSKGSWMQRLRENGIGTSIWTTNPKLSQSLTHGFTSINGPKTLDRKAGFEAEFKALDEWLYTRGRKPFFMYIDLAMPIRGRRLADEETFRAIPLSERVPEVTEKAVLQADFWIGQTVGALNNYGLSDDTAVIITGSATRTRGSYRGTTLSPARLAVPMIIWHPKMRAPGFVRKPVNGLDLADLRRTIEDLLGARMGPDENSRSVLENLFYEKPLAVRHASAKTPYGWVIRYGEWLLWPRAAIKDRLWHRGDVNAPRDITEHPIIVRALRRRASGTR